MRSKPQTRIGFEVIVGHAECELTLCFMICKEFVASGDDYFDESHEKKLCFILNLLKSVETLALIKLSYELLLIN